VAGRRFDVADVVEVLQHWQAGRSTRALSRSLGMGRDRVRAIVARAEAAGLAPGGPPLSREEWEQRVPELFAARLTPPVTAQGQLLAGFHEAIVAGLATNTERTVWQRLRDERGLTVSESTFRRYVEANVREGVRRERVTVRKEVTPPGQVAEVDYECLGRWTNPRTGKRHAVHGFVMTLASSRLHFVDVVLSCDQSSWVASHVAAFEFFGAAPREIRLDNLKTGVLRADIYDPQLNRSYAELAQHYGLLLDPCRAGKPKDKPRVERAVPYVRDSFWRGRDFGSVQEMKEAALRWCRGISAARSHGTLPGTVGEVFDTLERPALLELPEQPFEIAHWAVGTLHPDCHVQVAGHFYSAPWRHVGKRLHVRVGERVVRIYDGNELLKTHLRRRGQRRYTDPADYPPEKIAFLQRTPAWCRRRAEELGPDVVALVAEMLAGPHPLACLRQAQGVVRLADTFDAERLNIACGRALLADGSLRTVRTILAKGLDLQGGDGSADARHVGAFLHGQQVLLAETSQ
jgi:transposase